MQTTAYKKSLVSPISFLVGALLFLLPFVEIKCNNMTVMQNSGLGLALGSEFEASKELQSMNLDQNKTKSTDTDTDRDTNNEVTDDEGDKKSTVTGEADKTYKKQYIVAAIALGLGILGFLLSLAGGRSLSVINGLLGIGAAACLLILMFQLKPDIENQMKSNGSGDNPMDQMANSMKPTVVFTLWYYLSIAAFLIAAFFSFRGSRSAVVTTAPQVIVRNPGDQSEFPAAPTGEKDLG